MTAPIQSHGLAGDGSLEPHLGQNGLPGSPAALQFGQSIEPFCDGLNSDHSSILIDCSADESGWRPRPYPKGFEAETTRGVLGFCGGVDINGRRESSRVKLFQV